MLPQVDELPFLTWMPSRIPIRDALVTFIVEGETPPQPPYPCSESRWYPVDGGIRMVLPYDGQRFDDPRFQIERNLWDHSTCDACRARIEAMNLLYVTASGKYVGLCDVCYAKLVVSKIGGLRAFLWHVKRLVGVEAPA